MAALGTFSRTEVALAPSPAGAASMAAPVGIIARMLAISLSACGSRLHLNGLDTADKRTLRSVREGALKLARAWMRAPRVGV